MRRQAVLLRSTLLVWEVCRCAAATDEDDLGDEGSGLDTRPQMFPSNEVWHSRSVIAGFVLVFLVMVSIAAVLVMGAKEEDGHVMTSLISKEAGRLTMSAAELAGTDDMDASGGQDEPNKDAPEPIETKRV